MRIALKVFSSNHDWDGDCAFAVVELSRALATLALRRIGALKEQKNVDSNIDEVYYWASFVECYFSPWTDLASGDEGIEGTSVALAEMLDQLQVEEKEVVTVPDSFRVPASQIAAVECEQMIVSPDSIRVYGNSKTCQFLRSDRPNTGRSSRSRRERFEDTRVTSAA